MGAKHTNLGTEVGQNNQKYQNNQTLCTVSKFLQKDARRYRHWSGQAFKTKHMEQIVPNQRLLLRTADAADALNLSQGHLKLQMDIKDGPLEAGVHYFLGPHRTSVIQWDIERCREKFHHLGMLHRAADQAPTLSLIHI